MTEKNDDKLEVKLISCVAIFWLVVLALVFLTEFSTMSIVFIALASTFCGSYCIVKRKTKTLFWVISICIAAYLIVSLAQINVAKEKKRRSSLTAEELQKEEIEKHFSVWDGSHNGLTRYIKNDMKDPSSYEHVETAFLSKGTYLIVITKFRGSNSFGAIVTNTIRATVDLEGNVITIIN